MRQSRDTIVFGAANLESLIELSALKTAMNPAEFFDASWAAKAQC